MARSEAGGEGKVVHTINRQGAMEAISCQHQENPKAGPATISRNPDASGTYQQCGKLVASSPEEELATNQ
ncbi:hypothetical protein N7508_007011 [Penicillium antarcticum]|uniref:uncharacterized protein n=1 Tax=Penicillium antarcticum TaxID=416450 RepID=UPI00238E9EB2|nr:uncharacterized protein N7508_007011 [Penicillium antarcticum]KAJ5302148.1 hypothetical protein N7508_007011 [Penicillium antarcticum]